jgi:hypothetical protein
MSKINIKMVVTALILIGVGVLSYSNKDIIVKKISSLVSGGQTASVAYNFTSPFLYKCSVNGILSETGSMSESSSAYFWMNSGAYTYLKDGVCQTIQGELPTKNKWSKYYKISNPVDTDNGLHPQNIYRLVTRFMPNPSFSQEVSFNIAKHNPSLSPENDAWSGFLLFQHYQSGGQTLYYSGIRYDGHAVIKKKKDGVYTTLAEVPYFRDSGTYNKVTNPTLIPLGQWMGIKSEIKNNPNNTVSLKLFISPNNDGVWNLVASTTDTTDPILTNGYAGIRTDFSDVTWDNLRILNI